LLANAVFGAIGNPWSSQLDSQWTLESVEAIDLSTSSGAGGVSTSAPLFGTGGSTAEPAQVAMLINWQIARRYRGGKPKTFLPGAGQADLASDSTWAVAAVSAANTTASQLSQSSGPIVGHTFGSITIVFMVNVSYYQGFTNVTHSNGRTDSVPKLRSSPVIDQVIKGVASTKLHTQKRRLLAS
jgi:hypothetical protein